MRDKSQREVRELSSFIEEQGLRVLEAWKTKRSHYRIRVALGGAEATITAPSEHGQSSDSRTMRNWRAQVARIARDLRAKNLGQLTQESRSS